MQREIDVKNPGRHIEPLYRGRTKKQVLRRDAEKTRNRQRSGTDQNLFRCSIKFLSVSKNCRYDDTLPVGAFSAYGAAMGFHYGTRH